MTRVRSRRLFKITLAICALGLGALLLAGVGRWTIVSAETTAKRAPKRSQPARTGQSAPDTTGTLAKAAPVKVPSAPQSVVPDGVPPSDVITPFYLPNVPRSRMHACGEAWRTKKMAGTTGEDDWRDFAVKCLAEVPSDRTGR